MNSCDQIGKWHRESALERVRQNLQKRAFNALILPDGEALRKYLAERIPAAASAGLGGSLTLRQLGVDTDLRQRGVTLLDHWQPGLKPEEVAAIRKRQLHADFFLSSVNALTEAGEIVNIDGIGNRVASMIFGPGEVVVVAGKNKIVRNLEEALWRIKNVATPQNARRLGLQTPCSVSGRCQECPAAVSICRATAILNFRPNATPFTVILMPLDLGF